jgi:predicted metalloprotease
MAPLCAHAQSPPEAPPVGTPDTPQDPEGQSIARLLGSTEVVWGAIFSEAGQHYREPTLVLYRDTTRSPCTDPLSVSPSYCDLDQKIYLDVMPLRKCTKGDECLRDQGFMLAREVGHHVQNLLGIRARLREQMSKLPADARTKLSLREELQADCMAGIWGGRVDRTTNEGLHLAGISTAIDSADATFRTGASPFGPETSALRRKWFENGFTGDQY